MCREKDEAYASRLIKLAQTDAEHAVETGDPGSNRRALALWMADELQRESARLDLSERIAGAMREAASAIRYRVTSALPRA